MRLVPSLLSFVAILAQAGCFTSGEDLSAEEDRGDDGDSGGGAEAPEAPECDFAYDCVAAGSTCCECPAFAVPVSSGYQEGCADVSCDPEPTGCSATVPECVEGRCELICLSLVTEQTCATGFASDDFGCLLDRCADSGSDGDECEEDVDCVQVPADCCGCARGGSDTAVPAGTEDDYADSLECPSDPTCPDVYVCDPESQPRCMAGTCRLGSPPGDGDPDDGAPSVLCGTGDAPPCAEGQVCVLNHPDAGDATQVGAGSCQDP